MKGCCWADGELISLEERILGGGDPGAMLGQGVFESFRLREGGVSHLDQHLARLGWGALRQGCAPVPPLAFEEILLQLLRATGLPQARARITLRAPGTQPRLLIQVLPLSPEIDHVRRQGLALEISPFVRSANDPTVAIKLVSRGFLDRAKSLAQEMGADDALLLGEEGQILETTTANFFLIDAEGRLATTTLCDAFLPGITRARVLEAARGLGLEMGSNWLMRGDIAKAREAFVSNAVLGVVPVRRLGPWGFPLGRCSLELQRILDD